MIIMNYCGTDYTFENIDEALNLVFIEPNSDNANLIKAELKNTKEIDISDVVGCCCTLKSI